MTLALTIRCSYQLLPENIFKTQSDIWRAVLIPAEDLVKPVFRFSHEYKMRTALITLESIMESGGVCLVSMVSSPSYVDIVYRMDSDTDYPRSLLEYHKISMSFMDLAEELPACVQAKLQQMESRRDWSRWDQDGLTRLVQTEFSGAGLDYTEFAVLQSPNTDALTTDTIDRDFSSGYSPRIRHLEIGFLSSLITNRLHRQSDIPLEENALIKLFHPLCEWTEVAYQSPDRYEYKIVMPEPTIGWPNNMGLLTQRRDEHNLRLVRSQSDASIFWNYEPLFFTGLDSCSSGNDMRRVLAQAACWVRLQNRNSGNEECCVPIFYIDDENPATRTPWTGECFLVYEKDNQILYYRLKYQPPRKDFLPTFSLADVHSRAHFHLRLLNAADPRYRQLTIAQQTVAQCVWEKLNNRYGLNEDYGTDEDCGTDEDYSMDEEA